MKWLLTLLTVCFFVGLQRHAHPTFRTFLDFSDHFSHTNSVLLFFEKGLDIFGTPTQELCAPTATPTAIDFATQNRMNPADLCQIEGKGRIYTINWQQRPRTYPLGTLLIYAPPALGLLAGLSFVDTNQLTVLWLFLLAALSIAWIYFDSRQFLGWSSWDQALPYFLAEAFTAWMLLALGISGLPDLVSIAFLILSFLTASKSPPQWGRAWLWASLAAFTHFRAFWYGPWYLVILWKLWRNDRNEFRKPRFWVSTTLLLFSSYTFLLGFPAMQEMPINNPLFHFHFQIHWTLWASLLFLCTWFVWLRAWLLLSLLTWSMVFAIYVHEVRFWHIAFWLPLLWITARTERALATTIAVLGFIFLMDEFVYGSQIFFGLPLRALF